MNVRIGLAGGDLARLARTAAHVQPGQVGQRARLRAQRAALHRWPHLGRWLLTGPDPGAAITWPGGFSPLDAQVWRHWPGGVMLRSGQIDLLGTTRTLTQSVGADRASWENADWEQAHEPLLWRFHLHYWDWGWGLAAEPDRADARALFAKLWRSWRSVVLVGRGVPWHPYPVALRAWSYCGLFRDLVAGGEIESAFLADLAAHAGFLRRHLETDVGGNHLIKNLKALVGLGVFFADQTLLDRALDRLIRQLSVQVLPDGGHYERAPAYHSQVLADLIDIAGLLQSAGRTPVTELQGAIRRMRRWLSMVLSPGGGVPLLNDGFPVSPELLAAFRLGPPPGEPLLMLPDTGLVRATVGRWHLLADVGLPCPDQLPAHAHADTLGCLLHVDGEPLLVDTGTSTYAAGPTRAYERSTAAHNTVEVDETDSTEVWGAFRAARRARVHDPQAWASAGNIIIDASHDGYRHLPGRPCHRRQWSLTGRAMKVDDLITGRGRHHVVVRWHFAPGTQLRLAPNGATAATPTSELAVSVTATSHPTVTVESAPLSCGFGRTVSGPVLTCGLDAILPVRISTAWQRASDRQGVM